MLSSISMSKRDHWEITLWIELCTKVVATVKDNITAGSLQSVTINCLDEDLRAKKTNLSISNVISKQFNLDQLTIYVLQRPIDDPFSHLI
jgi:hypothetical protein